MTPEISSALRSILIAIGTLGVAKGWYDAATLESLVGYILSFGGAALTLGAAAWGIYAKRPRSDEALKVAQAVVDSPSSVKLVNSPVEEVK